MATPTWPGPGHVQKNKAHKVPYSTNDHPRKSKRSGAFGGYNLKCRVPSPDDQVFSSTASVLEGFNQKDFHYKADPIRTHAYSTTPTIFYDYESAPAVHVLRRTKTWIKVHLKIVCDLDERWDTGTVFVKDRFSWVPLLSWLELLPNSVKKDIDKAALELQRQCWLRDGGYFRFLELPTELQKRILLFAIGEYVAPGEPHRIISHSVDRETLPYTAPRSGDAFVRRRHIQRRPLDALFISPVNAGLLRSSKKLRYLALETLWADTTMVFKSVPAIDHILLHAVQPKYLNMVHRIHLHSDYFTYVEDFCVGVYPFRADRRTERFMLQSMSNLKKLPCLRYLELYFYSTIVPWHSPWKGGMHGDYCQLPDIRSIEFRDIDIDRYPCQKVLIDQIMCFVWEHVKHISRVKLTGYVKTETKEKWEHLLNNSGTADHSTYVQAMNSAVLEAPPSEFLPPCFCRHPCGYTRENSRPVIGRRGFVTKEALAEYAFDFDG